MYEFDECVLVVNLGSLLLISGSYLWMFFVAKMTHRATETLIRHRSLSESAMAWRMSLLVATDAACWVPIIGLGLWSLAGFTVHPQVKINNAIILIYIYRISIRGDRRTIYIYLFFYLASQFCKNFGHRRHCLNSNLLVSGFYLPNSSHPEFQNPSSPLIFIILD